MSHDATNWAIKQRGLKPTTKIVLWHLCDRFNPDYGCFPSQARLAHDCEISRATLNRHLDGLEAGKLIRRIRVIDPTTGQQRPTRYVLGFEPGFTPRGPGQIKPDSDNPFEAEEAQTPCLDLRHGPTAKNTLSNNGLSSEEDLNPCLKSEHGPVSQFGANPCLKNGDSRVSNCDTNLVREPLREPVKEEEDAAARDCDFNRFFAELLSALGFANDATLPAWWQGWPARTHVRRWIDDLGLSEDRILESGTDDLGERSSQSARWPQSAGSVHGTRGPARCQLPQAPVAGNPSASRMHKARPPPSPDELAAFYAAKVNSDEYLPQWHDQHRHVRGHAGTQAGHARRLRMRGVR